MTVLAAILGFTTQGAHAVTVATNATTAVSNNSTATMSIPVAAGLKPQSISGQIAAPEVTSGTELRPGTVSITAGGQPVYNGPARAATFSRALNNPAITQGRLEVSVTYNVPTDRNNFCATDSQQIRISDVRINLVGNQAPPTTVAGFLPPGTNAVNVLIPENPTPDVLQAGLAAVGAATFALEPSAQVRLSLGTPDKRIIAVPGARIISLTEGANPVTTSIGTNNGVPQLSISGSGDELADAASALGGSNVPLAGAADTQGLSQISQNDANLTLSFTDLGAKNPTLTGWGNQTLFVGADQSAFGGAISDATVRVVGTHSAIPPGATATLNVYWNDSVIASTVLDSDPGVDISAQVPNSYMQTQNGLTVVMTTVPAGGNCTGSQRFVPIKLSLDSQQSQVSAKRGQTLSAGFQRFPQAFGDTLPVAFAEGAPINETAVQAGFLVAALQRANEGQLLVEVMPLNDVVSSSATALIVGANEVTSNDLRAPLRLTEFRSVSSPSLEFQVGLGIPYAALEAFATGNRNLIMLGSWAPDDAQVARAQQTATELAESVYVQPGGWGSLGGDILLAQPGSEAVQLDSNSVVPQQAAVEQYNTLVWWLLGLLLLFFALGAWRYSSIRRTRRKVAEYVDAQEAADRRTFGEADDL